MTKNHKSEVLKIFTVICLSVLLLSACYNTGNRINEAISAAGTDTSQLATQVTGLRQDDNAQQELISDLSTQMSVILETATITPTQFPLCTPPACAKDEMYYCPGDCPGGCGTTCATATPGVSSGTGQVRGQICFPGAASPAMTIYFLETNSQQILSYPIAENQESYQFRVPAGVYLAFAWLQNEDTGGGFTEFVGCSKTLLPCTDHSLTPFLVRENHGSTRIDICDWETDLIVFPAIPDE
jgi:outer membrane murein-binding lipoprotein Lpp